MLVDEQQASIKIDQFHAVGAGFYHALIKSGTFLQRHLGSFGLSNIEMRANNPDHLTICSPFILGTGKNPADLARIGPFDAIFDIEAIGG